MRKQVFTGFWEKHNAINTLIGSLRSYDGNCNVIDLFCDYSMLVALYKMGGVHFRLLDKNGFHEGLTAASWRCRQNLWKFHVVAWLTTSKRARNKNSKRVPHVEQRGARLYFFIQLITYIIDL